MRNSAASEAGSVAIVAALMLAVFTVTVGYGVLLPLLPHLIERLQGADGDIAQVPRQTGLLTAVYTLSLFLFAPLWGLLSDRRAARGVLLVGLIGFGATMLIFSFIESLASLYAERFMSGMFAAAVTPIAAAVIAGMGSDDRGRAHRLAFISIASGAGFLLGPMLGVIVLKLAAAWATLALPAGSVALPLGATGMLALLAACAVAFALPGSKNDERSPKVAGVSPGNGGSLVPRLLVLTFIVSAGVGVFEVGLALRGKQELGLTPYQIALMFTECSLVMFVVQAIVFSPWFDPDATRWLIAPALLVLAAALFLVPWASDFTWMLVVIGAVAGSAGILSPILTFWISTKAGAAQGWELGKQTAASSLGVAAGSAAGGLLFNVAAIPGASFVLAALLALVGFVLSLNTTRLLMLRDSAAGPGAAGALAPKSS